MLYNGRQNGGRRVVATFFDLSSQICSGSPATKSMTSGVESEKGMTDDNHQNSVSDNESTSVILEHTTINEISKETLANNFENF